MQLVRLVAALAAVSLTTACRPSDEKANAEGSAAIAKSAPEPEYENPLGPNAACYVCHMTFVGEELTQVHIDSGVACIECHGLSDGHANDEDIGATPPDKVIERNRIDASCYTCHETHDVDPELMATRRAERSEWRAAVSQPADPSEVCTDCHGQHRITE